MTRLLTLRSDDADKLLEVKIGQQTVKEFTYDSAGRTTAVETSAGTTTLSYDYESRVTGITYPSQATNSFTYNGLDTRVGTSDSGGSKTFLRDGVSVTSPVLSDGSADYTPAISERRSSTTTFYHGGIKNGDSQSNTSESVTGSIQYDAFGNVTSSSGTWQGPFAYGGPYGYQTDSDSGLKLLGHRYYDPSTGRFLTRDPIKDGRNWYGYCDNNPLRRVDPSGSEWHDPAQVHVSPNFKGQVWVIGEPWKGYDPDGDGKEDQINMRIPPGMSSPLGMDVDIVVIVYPDGSREYYFLMGIGYLIPGPQDYYVDKRGYIYGPNVWGLVPFVHDWRKDIEKAKKTPVPRGLEPFPQPCYLPGTGPWSCETP